MAFEVISIVVAHQAYLTSFWARLRLEISCLRNMVLHSSRHNIQASTERAPAHWWNPVVACGRGFVDPGGDVSEVFVAWTCAVGIPIKHRLPELYHCKSRMRDHDM